MSCLLEVPGAKSRKSPRHSVQILPLAVLSSDSSLFCGPKRLKPLRRLLPRETKIDGERKTRDCQQNRLRFLKINFYSAGMALQMLKMGNHLDHCTRNRTSTLLRQLFPRCMGQHWQQHVTTIEDTESLFHGPAVTMAWPHSTHSVEFCELNEDLERCIEALPTCHPVDPFESDSSWEPSVSISNWTPGVVELPPHICDNWNKSGDVIAAHPPYCRANPEEAATCLDQVKTEATTSWPASSIIGAAAPKPHLLVTEPPQDLYFDNRESFERSSIAMTVTSSASDDINHGSTCAEISHGLNSPASKQGTSAPKSPKQAPKNEQKEKKRLIAWTPEEHQRFLFALEKLRTEDTEAVNKHGKKTKGLGPGIAEVIALAVGTRNAAQVRSHAQKHFTRQRREMGL